jgi:STE24 endopeptidase
MRIHTLSVIVAWQFSLVLMAQETTPVRPVPEPAAQNAAVKAAEPVTALQPITPASARPEDIKAATDAWLATVSPTERAKSDAYFEGGYWLQLSDFLIGVVLAWLFLGTRLSIGMRNLAERLTSYRPVQSFVYFVAYAVLMTAITFPMAAYETYFREAKYGLMNLTFGGWFKELMIENILSLALGGIAVVTLFGIVRRLPRTWWIWGALFAVVLVMFGDLISPVYVAPLFNDYKKLEDPKIRDPILSMARANGVPVSDVYWFDASRQSKRVSANMSGFLGTERISLNDNLLNRCTPPEVLAVLGHEIGHYVLNHAYKGMMFFCILIIVFFAYLRWSLSKSLARWGPKWGIRGIGDVAVIPLVVLLASVFFFVLSPITNGYTRVQEIEADMYGLNAARQPDAEAHVDLMLGEYRKLDPTPLEEFLFFDHPSGRNRIYTAMQWKAEHLSDCDLNQITQSGVSTPPGK